MTPSDRLSFFVDWERDGTYDHALSNITPYVLSADWTLGFQEPYQLIGGPSELELMLDNSNGDWNILKTGALFNGVLLRDVLVQIRFFHNSATWYLGTYKLKGISISPGAKGERIVRLSCADWHADFMGTVYDPPLATNTTTSAAIQAAFDNGGVPGYPLAAMNFIVDGSTLDETTTLPNYSGYLNTFAGSTTLDYVGDNIDANGEGVSLYSFIEEMCIAEFGGRFRFQVNTTNGKPYYSFYGRTSLTQLSDDQSTHTIDTSDFRAAEYVYGSAQCNQVDITYYPRSLGSAGVVVATQPSPMAISGLDAVEFDLRFTDPDAPGAECAAIDLIPPVATTDYTGNLESDGSGENYTGNLVVSIENLTNAVRVKVTNTALGTVYLTSLQVRGTPLIAHQPVTVSSADGESIATYGLYKKSMTISGSDDEGTIRAFADWYVKTRGVPYAEYKSITFDYTDETDAGLATYVYEPLSDTEALAIQDNWTEDTADASEYWVCGMRCSVYDKTWEVTLILENYGNIASFWQLENTVLGVLDQTTRLAF